jgi:hypothetical protein
VFSCVSNRDADHRALANDAAKSCNRHGNGMGIATVALIDSTVSVTARQSDSVPIASEVAIAPSNREEATGARLLSKPTAPDDPIIGLNPCNAGRITRDSRDVTQPFSDRRQHYGDLRLKMAEPGQRLTLCPLLLTFGGILARK